MREGGHRFTNVWLKGELAGAAILREYTLQMLDGLIWPKESEGGPRFVSLLLTSFLPHCRSSQSASPSASAFSFELHQNGLAPVCDVVQPDVHLAAEPSTPSCSTKVMRRDGVLPLDARCRLARRRPYLERNIALLGDARWKKGW